MEELEKAINYTFLNKKLLKTALTHTSYANEQERGIENNERLEFLGDAVMQIIVSVWLFALTPPLSEGEMTRRRAALVCEQSFAAAAARAGLGGFLYLGKGEAVTGGNAKPSILADAFEALIAAVYLDGGLNAARDVALGLLDNALAAMPLPADSPPAAASACHEGTFNDYKSALNEKLQADGKPPAKYIITSEEGPPHNKLFTASAYDGKKRLGEGVGKTKKEAEQGAAKAALGATGECL